jgi:membrane protease YdiL (CAAX protease family)
MNNSDFPPESSPSETKSSSPSDFLFGPDGLRSGWGFFFYLALCVLLIFLAQKILVLLLHGQKGTLWTGMIVKVVLMLCVLLPAVPMAGIEKRTFGGYGLPMLGAFGKKFWYGVLWGFVGLSALLLAMRGADVFYFGAIGLHGFRALKFAAFWGVSFLLVGFFEEFLFRGYTLFTLSRGMTFWPAAVVLSLAFGGVHLGNKGESWVGAVAAAAIAMFFCLTLRRTGTLWFAVGFHASWDWAESYFYGVPDSGEMVTGHLLNASFHGPTWLTGGSVGPEGSALVFLVIGVLFGVFHVLYPERATGAEADFLVSPQ